MKGARMYFNNIKYFIYNNNPVQLMVLTNKIVIAIEACAGRQACSRKEKGIVKLLKIIDEIQFCLDNCDDYGSLRQSFWDMKEQRQMYDDNVNAEVTDENMKLDQHGILDDRSENAKENDKVTRDASEGNKTPVKFKCIREEEYDGTIRKKIKDFNDGQRYGTYYPCDTDKIWSNDSENKLKGTPVNTVSSKKPIQNTNVKKDIPKKSPSTVRKNIYGYPVTIPTVKPKSPYVVPKEARPKPIPRRPYRKYEYVDEERIRADYNWLINEELHFKNATMHTINKANRASAEKQRKIKALNRLNAKDSNQLSENGSQKSSKSEASKKVKFNPENHSPSNSLSSLKSIESEPKSESSSVRNPLKSSLKSTRKSEKKSIKSNVIDG
jgi:hypothetical protein